MDSFDDRTCSRIDTKNVCKTLFADYNMKDVNISKISMKSLNFIQ